MTLSAPPELERLQTALREVFADPRGARAASAARPQALRAIRSASGADAATRLSVYGDGYFLRMLEALSLDYPRVLGLAGAEDFRVLVAEYVTAHPSTSPSLADLGERFPGFIASHRLGRRKPWLGDLARLERAVSESLLTDRRPALSPRALARVPAGSWNGARLALDPAARLLTTAWPVASAWSAKRAAPKAARAQSLLVARTAGGVLVRTLTRAEWTVLERLRRGMTLADSLEGLSPAPAKVQSWFAAWTAAGLIVGVLN